MVVSDGQILKTSFALIDLMELVIRNTSQKFNLRQGFLLVAT